MNRPTALVGLFDGLSDVIASGTADAEVLDGIVARHALEVSGPVPKGYL